MSVTNAPSNAVGRLAPLALLLVVVPLIFSTATHDAYHRLKTLALILLAGLFLAKRALKPNSASGRNRFFSAATVSFLTWAVFSMTSARNHGESWMILAQWTAVIFLGLETRRSLRGGQDVVRLACAIAVVGAVTSTYGLLQYLGWDFADIPPEARSCPVATFGNQNFAAEFLVLIVPLTTGLCFRLKTPVGKALCGYAVVVTGVHLLLTRCRGAWVGLALGVGVASLALVAAPEGRVWLRRFWKPLTGLTAILLVLATAFFSSPGGRAFVREAESIFDPRTGTNRTRIYMWEASLKMIRDHPLRGVGPGEFQYAYPAYRDPAERGLHGYNISTENPHNDYFHIGVETGIPGLLMFLGMIGWVLWDGRRRVVEARGVTLPFQLGRLCGLAGMAGAACFGFPFYMPASALLFWVIAGWPPDETGGEVASGGPSAELPKFQRSALTTVYALATVCGLAGALEGFYAVQGKTFFDFPAHWLGVTAFFWAMSVGRAMGAATPFPQKPTGAAPRISQSVSALRLSVALFLLSLFGATYAGLAGSLYRRQAKIADVQGRQATAEILYAKALGFETWNPALRFDFAQILHQLGKLDEAEQEYENTRRRHPEHEYVDRQLAEIQVQRGETEAALEFYARALRRNPNHVRARVGRGAIYLGRGDLTNAMEEFLTALESGAEKALPLYHLGLVLEKRGEYAAALARFEEALAADPNFYYAAACFNKAGALYFQAENWEKAERRFRAALDRAPGAAQPALNLALLYNKLGHRSLEREYLRRSLWAAPHQPAARSRYEQLGGDSKRIGAGETDD